MSARVLPIASILTVAVAFAAYTAHGALACSTTAPVRAAMPMMGMEHMLSQPSFLGYYDAKKDTYVSTDSSNKAQAAMMHVNYSAALAAVKGAPAIYLLEGRAASGQIAVFGSQPGESDYSPLWEEMIVKWKAGVKPTLLTSDNAILALQKKGKLTLTDSRIVLNCPIVKVGK